MLTVSVDVMRAMLLDILTDDNIFCQVFPGDDFEEDGDEQLTEVIARVIAGKSEEAEGVDVLGRSDEKVASSMVFIMPPLSVEELPRLSAPFYELPYWQQQNQPPKRPGASTKKKPTRARSTVKRCR